jgi:nucleoside triphosphate pyrophosphatase
MKSQKPKQHPTFILASTSPRRAQILREANYDFQIVPPPIDEPNDMADHVPPHAQAEALSYFKARSVAKQGVDGLILGADTIAAQGHHIFGKPADVADARHTLESLMGTSHQVITGVTLFDTRSDVRLIAHETTTVTMRKLTNEELKDFLDTGLWAGKAGAYGIQDANDPFVTDIDGSFTNVVGLPIDTVHRLMNEILDQPTAICPAATSDRNAPTTRSPGDS